MGFKVYISLAIVVSLTATIGADVYARTAISDESFELAVREHLYYARVQFIGTFLLIAPFVTVALICARQQKKSQGHFAKISFCVAMLALLFFYFRGYAAAQNAMFEEKWTAAALSVGLLPFFVGIPVVLIVAGISAAYSSSRNSD